MHHLVEHLGAGPVHVLCQDISGGPGFRFAATHPADVLSFTAVEAALAGYGLELLADVAHGGSWHVGFLAAPGIPELLLPGRERQLLADWAYPMMTAVKDAITDGDIDEFTRTYARPERLARHGRPLPVHLHRQRPDQGPGRSAAAGRPRPHRRRRQRPASPSRPSAR